MRRAVHVGLAAGLLALSGPAAGQTSPRVTIAVDATGPGSPLERVWAFHGYDEVNVSTTAEGQALLQAIAAADPGPVYVRNHFLFNTGDGTPAMKWGSTNVYTEDAAGHPVYDWTLTDGILDALTGAGTFPFVELGFMPQALSTHPDPYRNSSTTALDGGCFYPPADYDKWADLIRSWATHANSRAAASTAHWLWELWNEPDIGYWHGTFADYARLYDVTEAALHQVIPDAPLGGPAVAGAGGNFLTQFLQHCATGTNAVTGQTGTRLDLISFHAKGGVAVTDGHVEMDLGTQLRIHRAGFAAVAAFPQFKPVPIYVTEADPEGCAACPVSTQPADAYRLSPAYGAYEVAMMKHTLDLAAQVGIRLGGLLTWAFTFPGTPYFAGYRVLATNGIHLPVLGAFQLLGRLGPTRLPLTSDGARPLDDILANGLRGQPDVDAIAATDGSAIQVLVWNYHDDLVTAPAAPVRVTVQVPASFGPSARVAHLRVDEAHGDAYTTWVAQGMPASPSADQLAALRQGMDPAPWTADRTAAVQGGALAVDFDLPRFGLSLLTISPGTAPEQPGPAGSGGCGCSTSSGAGGGGLAVGLAVVLARRRRRRASAPRQLAQDERI